METIKFSGKTIEEALENAKLELKPEYAVELLILLTVVFQKLCKLVLYGLFKVLCDYLELSVLL